jgi:hypothetical protein
MWEPDVSQPFRPPSFVAGIALPSLCNTELYRKIIINSVWVRIWKEVVMVYPNILFRHSTGEIFI